MGDMNSLKTICGSKSSDIALQELSDNHSTIALETSKDLSRMNKTDLRVRAATLILTGYACFNDH